MDVSRMAQDVARGDADGAVETVRQDMALAGLLCRSCPRYCESGCRRAGADGAVSVAALVQHVTRSRPDFVPPPGPPSGRRIAIVGAGVAGLAAAYYLRLAGHACTLIEREAAPGGWLREAGNADRNDDAGAALEGEVRLLERLEVELRLRTALGEHVHVDDLLKEFDAVLIATGRRDDAPDVNRQTHECQTPGLFAAGAAARKMEHPVHAVASAKAAAQSIEQFLAGRPASGPARRFSAAIGRVAGEDLDRFLAHAGSSARHDDGRLDVETACEEAQRCLQCGCSAEPCCDLKRYAHEYGADANRFRASRRPYERHVAANGSGVAYDPGKCIACGRCVALTEAAGNGGGLTAVGRGIDMRPGPPLGRTMAEALAEVGIECTDACPTGALSSGAGALQNPTLGGCHIDATPRPRQVDP